METIVTEEPLPGWLRCEVPGKTPFYKSPFPRTVIRSAAMLGDFLRKEHAAGRCVEVTGTEFSFKRRLGLKMKPADPKVNDLEVATNEVDSVIAPKLYEHRSAVDLLTKDSGKTVDHRRLLSSMSRVLEEFRPKDPYQTPDTFENLKIKLSTASDLKDIIAVLMESQEVTNSLTRDFQ